MHEIDTYSYQCGIIDCFNEMVKAGLKPMALAHPCKTKQERDLFIPFVQHITNTYKTHFYLDDTPLITDLFAYSLNRDTFNIIFYQQEKIILEYQELKQIKSEAIKNHSYASTRENLAYRFGYLLGYPDERIADFIRNNDEKEVDYE